MLHFILLIFIFTFDPIKEDNNKLTDASDSEIPRASMLSLEGLDFELEALAHDMKRNNFKINLGELIYLK